MGRTWALAGLLLSLSGCGVAATGTAAAAGAASEARQAAEARATAERVRRQLDAASQRAAEQRAEAEAQGR